LNLDGEASTRVLLTTPGTIIGTVPYMSPEQVHGQPLDARTDIFSFGVLLYEMLTGEQPFAGETPAGTISAILTKQPGPVSDFVTNCPVGLDRLVARCLEKNREHRYQTMREVATEIESSGSPEMMVRASILGKPDHSPAVTVGNSRQIRPQRKSRHLLFAGIVLVVLALSTSALFWRTGWLRKNANNAISANDEYLQAKVLLTSENREDTEAAAKLLEQAVAADPNLARAWAELARAYYIKAFYYSPEESKQLALNAKVAYEKALALNPNLAEAHFVRGLLLWNHENRFPHEAAIQSYKQALALNPNLDEAHHQLGLVYFHVGLFDKGWSEIEKAVAINPSNTMARFRFGVIYLYRGEYENAQSFFKSTPLDKNPSLWAFQTATAMFQLGQDEQALALIDKYLKDYPKDEGGVGASVRAMIFARKGKVDEATQEIRRAQEIGRSFGHFHHTAYNIACAYALMNQPDQAVQWLETAADDGFPCYPLFANDVQLNNVRKDERFIAFMTKLKHQWERYGATL
jgi:tetratricopeptide (TPR) repeat protein